MTKELSKYLSIIALTVCSHSALANNFKPSPNLSLQYDAVSIETSTGLNFETDAITAGLAWYYNNNISFKISGGGGISKEEASINETLSLDLAKLNYIVSADLRYEFPFTNSFSTYAMVGASFLDIETTEDILNETVQEVGLKLGVGMSYVISTNTAIYAEFKQDAYSSDLEAQSYSAGFKFSF